MMPSSTGWSLVGQLVGSLVEPVETNEPTNRPYFYLFQCTTTGVVCANNRHSITCAVGLHATCGARKLKYLTVDWMGEWRL